MGRSSHLGSQYHLAEQLHWKHLFMPMLLVTIPDSSDVGMTLMPMPQIFLHPLPLLILASLHKICTGDLICFE